MKTYSIFLLIVMTVVSLWVVAVIGRSRSMNPTDVKPQDPVPTETDLPLPKTGPYGKVEVAETEFKFGARNVNDQDEHTFTFKNVGKAPLEFLMGKATCRCTLGEITKDNGEVVREGVDSEVKRGTLAPGESAKIRVQWKMDFLSEKFRQVVPVFTTDPDMRKIEFTITGTVNNLYEINPGQYWNVGDISPVEKPVAEGHIASKVVEEFTLTEVPRENSKLSITFDPIDQQTLQMIEIKSGYRIRVEVSTDVPVGRFHETFKLKAVSSYGEREFEFTVRGNRPGPVEVRGVVGAGFNSDSDRVLFKDFSASTGAKATMTLFVKGYDGDLVINSVEPESTHIKVTLLDSGTVLGKSKAYKAQIEIPPGPPANHRGIDAELIDLKLNHPEVPDFKLFIDYNSRR